MGDQSQAQLGNLYGTVIRSFTLGMIRFWGAEAAASRMMCALLKYRMAQGPIDPASPYAEVLSHLSKIPFSSYDALVYITNPSNKSLELTAKRTSGLCRLRPERQI
jgi:hypothetical protein